DGTMPIIDMGNVSYCEGVALGQPVEIGGPGVVVPVDGLLLAIGAGWVEADRPVSHQSCNLAGKRGRYGNAVVERRRVTRVDGDGQRVAEVLIGDENFPVDRGDVLRRAIARYFGNRI